MKKKLYYAHSLITYASDKEKNELEVIKKIFPDYEIVNPEKISYTGMNDCLVRVRSCTILVYSEYKQHIGKGVYLEIQEALSAGIPIFYVNNYNISEFGSLQITNQNDWKVKFATTLLGREVQQYDG